METALLMVINKSEQGGLRRVAISLRYKIVKGLFVLYAVLTTSSNIEDNRMLSSRMKVSRLFLLENQNKSSKVKRDSLV